MSSVVGGNQVSITREAAGTSSYGGKEKEDYIEFSFLFFLNRETNEENFSFHIIPSA